MTWRRYEVGLARVGDREAEVDRGLHGARAIDQDDRALGAWRGGIDRWRRARGPSVEGIADRLFDGRAVEQADDVEVRADGADIVRVEIAHLCAEYTLERVLGGEDRGRRGDRDTPVRRSVPVP